MSTEVPKDFYVGFSAQGDGWGANLSDWAFGGIDVTVGVASNYNTFYYGSVSGGQLVNSFIPSANAGFFVLTVSGKHRIPAVSAVSMSGGTLRLAITNLYRGETNTIQRNRSLRMDDWHAAGSLVCAGAETNWSEFVPADTNCLFYRIVVPGQ